MEMEDPEEWEIEEYSSSEENKSKLSWIWNKGLGLGKKIVVTGIFISSAPLLLPPLVVVSALGFAFSVPFGLVFASYAFTEKLMSKLLPLPGTKPPPLLLAYGMLSDEKGEEEEEIDDHLGFEGETYMEREEEEIGDLGFGGEVDMEREEEGIDDLGFGGEVGLEKEEEEQMEDTRGGVELPEENDDYWQMNEQESMEDVKESIKEEVYVEDNGEYLDLDLKQPLEEADSKIEGMREEGEEGPEIEESKDNQSVVHRGVPLVNGDEKNNGNVSEVKELIVVSAVIENEDMPERRENENVNVLPKEVKVVAEIENITEGNREEKNVNIGESNERKPERVVEIRVEEEQKPSIDKKGVMQGMVAKDLQMEKEKESEINSNTDSKESANKNHAAPRNEKDSDNKEENADLKELAETKNGIASGKDAVGSSNEALFTEEKIWEQIDAMRTIVGYKAATHATCIEELKALYIFTGVEPSASFKDKADLVEINAKLRFLKSVVGVK